MEALTFIGLLKIMFVVGVVLIIFIIIDKRQDAELLKYVKGMMDEIKSESKKNG